MSEPYVSYNCRNNLHGVCLKFYAGRVCTCECGHKIIEANKPNPLGKELSDTIWERTEPEEMI